MAKTFLNLAIVIDLVDDVLLESTAIIKTLNSKYGIDFIYNTQKTPHIVLSVGQVESSKLEHLVSTLESVLEKLSVFEIETNGLGLFLSEKINLHIRWHQNQVLVDVKKRIENELKSVWEEDFNYNSELRWIPKTTLAYNDINYVNLSTINFNELKIHPKFMSIREISIVKFEEHKAEEELRRITIGKGKK